MAPSANTGLSISLTEPVLFLRSGNEIVNRGRAARQNRQDNENSTSSSRDPSRPSSRNENRPANATSSANNSSSNIDATSTQLSNSTTTTTLAGNNSIIRSQGHGWRPNHHHGATSFFRSHDESSTVPPSAAPSRPHSPVNDHHNEQDFPHHRPSEEDAARRENQDLNSYPPTILRGLMILTLAKPSRIRKVSIRLKGTTKTEWPEGIGTRRLDLNDERVLINETHVYFSAKDEEKHPGFRRVNSAGATAFSAYQQQTAATESPNINSQRHAPITPSPLHPGSSTQRMVRSNSEQAIPSSNIDQDNHHHHNEPPIPTYEDSELHEARLAQLALSSSSSSTQQQSQQDQAHQHHQHHDEDDHLHSQNDDAFQFSPSTSANSERQFHRPQTATSSANPSHPSTPNGSTISLPHHRKDYFQGFSSIEHSPVATPSGPLSPIVDSPQGSPHNSVLSLDQFAHDVVSAPATARTSLEDQSQNPNANVHNQQQQQQQQSQHPQPFPSSSSNPTTMSPPRRMQGLTSGSSSRATSSSNLASSPSETSSGNFQPQQQQQQQQQRQPSRSRSYSSRLKLNSFSSAFRKAKHTRSSESNDFNNFTHINSTNTSPFSSPLPTPPLNGPTNALSSSTSSIPTGSHHQLHHHHKSKDRPSGLKALRHALMTGVHPHAPHIDTTGDHDDSEDDDHMVHGASSSSHDHHRWKEYPAGTYTYPISFSLPPTLPPTLKCDFGHVTYSLKASVHRAGVLTSNLATETEINLVACPGDDDLEETQSVLVERYWGTQLRYLVALSGKSFPIGGTLPLSIRLDPLDKVKVYRISAIIEEKVAYYGHDRKNIRHEGTRKYQLLRVENTDPLQPLLPITSEDSNALSDSPLSCLFVNSESNTEAVPSLLDPHGPWELETNLKIPDTRSRLRFSCSHDKANMSITHDLKVIIRVERGDEEQMDRAGRKKKFDIIIQTPVQVLSSECVWNKLPRYTSTAGEWMARAPNLDNLSFQQQEDNTNNNNNRSRSHWQDTQPSDSAFNTPLVLTAPPSPLLRPEMSTSNGESFAPFNLMMSSTSSNNNNTNTNNNNSYSGDQGGSSTPAGVHSSGNSRSGTITPSSVHEMAIPSSAPLLSQSSDQQALEQGRLYARLVEGVESETGAAPPSYESATDLSANDNSESNGVRTYVV